MENHGNISASKDFNKMCRACLATSEHFYHNLYDTNVSKMFLYCTSIQIVDHDRLPKLLCQTCYELLNKLWYFKQLCMQSNDTLQQCVQPESGQYIDASYIKTEPFLHDSATRIDQGSEENIVKFESKTEELLCDDTDHFDNGEVFVDETYLDEDYIESLPKVLQKEREENQEAKKIKTETIDFEVKIKKKRKSRNFDFPCTECNKRFAFEERLEAHKMEHQGKEVKIRCDACNKDFKGWDGLRKHNEYQHLPMSLQSLKCETCGKLFKSPHTLRRHQLTHEDRKLAICHLCGGGFKSEIILLGHLETHKENRERIHACKLCDKKFYTKNLLSTHVSRRHSGRRYICQVCSFPFVDKYSLTKHLLIHEGIKRYVCDICHRGYSTLSFLVEHKRIHTGERPFSCDFCAKSFISKKRLIDHRRIHTGEKPYKCNKCNQAFIQRGTLKRHFKVHDK